MVSTTPTTGATGLPFNPTISATFLQLPALDPDSAGAALNCSTVTAGTTGTFTVTSSAGAVTGTVACNQATQPPRLLQPHPRFWQQAPLYCHPHHRGQNVARTPLASPVVWTFTTDTLPTVTLTVPTNGTTGILLNQAISATFSKAMNCATLSPATTFTVTAGGTAVAGNVSCTGNGAIFTPSNLLAVNTLYTATITTGALDAQGEPMASNYSWNFRTVPATTAPTVISTNPANLATGVPTNIQAITATFSEAMNPATIGATTFTLKITGGAAVTGTVAYDVTGSVAVFTPSAALTVSRTRPRSQAAQPGFRIWQAMPWPAPIPGRLPPARTKHHGADGELQIPVFHPWRHRRSGHPGRHCDLQRGHEPTSPSARTTFTLTVREQRPSQASLLMSALELAELALEIQRPLHQPLLSQRACTRPPSRRGPRTVRAMRWPAVYPPGRLPLARQTTRSRRSSPLPCRPGHQCAHQPGCQRDLQQGHESTDDHLRTFTLTDPHGAVVTGHMSTMRPPYRNLYTDCQSRGQYHLHAHITTGATDPRRAIRCSLAFTEPLDVYNIPVHSSTCQWFLELAAAFGDIGGSRRNDQSGDRNGHQ